MNRLLPPHPDRSAEPSLVEQVSFFYEDAIRSGRLRRGDRLPSIREVAAATGLTRAQCQQAYQLLGRIGLVESMVGRGTTVLGDASRSQARGSLSAFAHAALLETRELPQAPPLPIGQTLVANFAELVPDANRFPVDSMRAAMDHVLEQRGRELLGYGHEAMGLSELRELLAERSLSVDPDSTADQILVTSGAQQGLDLVLRTFCQPGDAVVVTMPSYHQMAGLLKAHGLQVVPVAFGPGGLDLDQLAAVLRRQHVRLVYLMPSFHNPTGLTMDLAQREALLELMADTDVPILEDEYQQPLRFRGEELPPLRVLDPRGLTVTVQTFSKGLFPGLRVGWVHARARALQPMAAVKRFMDLETSPLLQAALVEFVRQGALDAHLRELSSELAERHRLLQEVLAPRLPEGCSISDPDGGFVAWLGLPRNLSAAGRHGPGERLAELAAARGVRVVPGSVFDALGRPSWGVRLSLSCAERQQIRAGAGILAEVVEDLVGTRPIAASRHFL
jgi:2-aminoadipate transaminase